MVVRAEHAAEGWAIGMQIDEDWRRASLDFGLGFCDHADCFQHAAGVVAVPVGELDRFDGGNVGAEAVCIEFPDEFFGSGIEKNGVLLVAFCCGPNEQSASVDSAAWWERAYDHQ